MFRSKKDVDRHVKDLFLKLKNEEEKNLRCYNIAKLYQQVGDYESAKRYVSRYLEVRDGSVGAHKLLGQALEALGQKEAALTQYKTSLELDPKQDLLILKVCELLTDMDVSMDINRLRYWVERADKLFPHDPIVFRLKEKMLTADRSNDNSEDLEALITSELSVRRTDVHLRVKLLEYYIAKNRLEDAYNHAAGVEATFCHRNSTVWYQSLSELLTKCKESKKFDWNFWIFYISVLERYVALCLKEQGNEVQKTVQDAAKAIFAFDQSLTSFKSESFTNNPVFMENMFSHMTGQLHYHLACLLLRKTKREQGSWVEAGRLCAPLFLTALHVTPIDPTAAWVGHLKDRLKSQIQLWYKEGCYRCSQAGHVLRDYGRDNTKKLLERIEKSFTRSWREWVYARIFTPMHEQLTWSSYFLNSTSSVVSTPPMRLCSDSELRRNDEISEQVWPDSLHHQIWLGLKSRPHSQNKEGGPHPNQTSHVFPELQFSVYNLSQAAPDSLSRLDIDAFLNAAILCASAMIEEQQLSGFLNPERLDTLPADLTNTLCTCTQEKWWSSAYKMYSIDKQKALEGDIGEIRQELQRGLEVVRCIGNHGLHPILIVHLARIFHYRVNTLKEIDKEHSDIPALEARCEMYWSNAVPLLERLQNNQTIRVTSSKLFNYQGKEMNNAELTNALEEGKLLLAQRFVRDKQYEQAIEALQALKCPEASFQQGQIYKLLADEIVSSMPRESVTSEMRSQHIIMLSKARNSLYLTLDRLRSPGTNPKHPLNAELCTHIADIENELKRIDPDLSRGDLSRNECDGMSDESYSSAHSAADQAITNAPLQTLTALNASVNMLSTPQRNNHRTPKQSTSTPYRPQHQDILDLSRNRSEARPSPERLDAQIRQMIHSRDTVMQTILEQNKAVLESNKVVMEKLEELVKEIAELRKDYQRQRTQSINANPNLEEDLYALGEDDYNDLNYNANQSGAASSISGNMFQSSHRHPYSPLVYPSTFQGYYQGGIPFTDPNAQPIPSLYPPNVYPMPVLYPNTRSKISENILQQGLFNSRLPGQLPDLMPPTNPPMQVPLQKVETSKPEIIIKDAPVNKVPPVNVVITTSDTLPTTAPVVQPTLSVTIPPHYRLGTVPTSTTVTSTEQVNVPHCYQISMPSQATIPTTVNLPPLATTLTTTPANMSMPDSNMSTNVCATGSANNSLEVAEVEVEHDPIPDFVPVIPLPAEVKVTTGEEDEVTLYCARAKLFRFVDKEWKERGIGNVKLLKNAEGKVRLLMRRDQVLKICANHLLRPDMELTPMTNNEKAWMWVANDFADEEVKLEKLCIKFKTVEEALSFKDHFDKARVNLSASPDKLKDKPSRETSEKAPVSTEQPTFGSKSMQVPTEKKTSEATDKSKTVGGLSFTSKPIIQKVATTESEEPPKVSPFAGFTFNKTTDTSAQKPASQPFYFGKPPQEPVTPVNTPTTGFPSQPATTTAPASTNFSLRRPHAPAPAAANVVAIQDDVNTNPQTESEQVLFESRMSLQCYSDGTKQLENQVVGQMKILLDTKTGKVRLVMHDENARLCYVHRLLSKTSFTFKSGSNTTINWSMQHGKENKTTTFAAIFELPDQASQFYNTILNNQQKMVKDCIPMETKKQEVPKVQPALSEMFKPPSGSWECPACYVRNDAKDTKCIACEPVAPVAPVTKPTTTTPSNQVPTNQIPLSQLFKKNVNSWECTSCLISNQNSNNYCVACDTPKDPSMPPNPETKNCFQIGAPPSGTTPTFTFGIPQGASETPGKFTFGFPPGTNAAVSDPAKTDTPKFVFGTQKPSTPPNKTAPFTFGSPGKSFDFNFVAKSPAKSPTKTSAADTSEEEVVESDDIHFLPIIPLPDKIEVKTGEEEEEIVYSHRAKLFRFDPTTKEWKERGLGDIKILRHKDTSKLRLIMRRDQILKLCLNHFVLPDLEVTVKDEKTWQWNAADYSEGKIEYTHFACRFKTPEIAAGFKKALDDARSGKPTVVENKTEKTEKASPPQQDIEVLYETKVTAEEKAAALKLQLPINFYAYKQKPDCPGCRGCREPSVPLFEDTTSQKTSQEKLKSTETGKSVQSISASTPNETKVEQPGSTTSTNTPIFKTVFSAANTEQFTPSFSTPTGFDTSAMSFGSSDSSNNKKTTGFSFGMPQTQLSEQKSNTEKQVVPENLKICSPSISQVPVTTANIFGSPVSSTGSPTTSIFGTPNTESPFAKNMFGGSTKKDAIIKPSSFNVNTNSTGNLFSNNFDTQPATTPIFGGTGTTNTSVFGAKTNSETAESAANPSPLLSSSISTFGTSSKATSMFTNTSTPFSFNLSFGNGTNASPFGTNTTSTNIFETKPTENAAPKEPISFLTTNDVTFSTLAANAPQQEVFKRDPNFSFAGAGTSVFGVNAAANDLQKKNVVPPPKNEEPENEECEENENDQEHDPHFEPIIPLPDVVEVRTGEEDEEKVFSERAKLFRFNSNTHEWKERGVGEMKILHHAGQGTYRLLLRREQVHKVVCNLLLTSDMEFQKLSTSDQAWIWAGMNYAEEQPSLEQLAVKFKNRDLAQKFKNTIDNIQRTLSETREKGETSPDVQEPEDEEEEDEEDEDEIDEIDEHEEEEAEEEENHDEDDQNSIIFERKAYLYARDSDGAKWKDLPQGDLLIYNDSDSFGRKIIMKAEDTDEITSEVIISTDTQMQIEGRACIWTAIDYALEPPTIRTLKAVFIWEPDAQEMYKHFQDGVEYAKQAGISLKYQ